MRCGKTNLSGRNFPTKTGSGSKRSYPDSVEEGEEGEGGSERLMGGRLQRERADKMQTTLLWR